MRLTDVAEHTDFIISNIAGAGADRARLLDLGFVPGTVVTVRKTAPFKRVWLLELRGFLIALSGDAAMLIEGAAGETHA